MDSIEEIAERIDRAGDRCRNAGDFSGERAARMAATQARSAASVEQALAIEQQFHARIAGGSAAGIGGMGQPPQRLDDRGGCLFGWLRGRSSSYSSYRSGPSFNQRTVYVHDTLASDTYSSMTFYDMVRHQHPDWDEQQVEAGAQHLAGQAGVAAESVVGDLPDQQLSAVAAAIVTSPDFSSSDSLPDLAPGGSLSSDAWSGEGSDASSGSDFSSDSSSSGSSDNS